MIRSAVCDVNMLQSVTDRNLKRSHIMFAGKHGDDCRPEARSYARDYANKCLYVARGPVGCLWWTWPALAPCSSSISPRGGRMWPEAHKAESETAHTYHLLSFSSISSS